MVKDKTLIIRLTEAEKKDIENAAKKSGISMTTFAINTILKETKTVLSEKERMVENVIVRPTHKGVPTFFRVLCLTASQGGTHSYQEAGYHLASTTDSEMPFETDEDEWAENLQELEDFIINQDRDGIWRWYRQTYTRAMALVPIRRKDSFVDGVLEAFEEGRLWFS